jgi:hypothetical protein
LLGYGLMSDFGYDQIHVIVFILSLKQSLSQVLN